MDPNAALAEIRRLIRSLEFQVDSDTGLVDLDDASELVDKFRGLDEWISNGGYLPMDWEH